MDRLRIGVIGLGLMGGSLARALAARGVLVLGYDRDQSSMDAAVAACHLKLTSDELAWLDLASATRGVGAKR